MWSAIACVLAALLIAAPAHAVSLSGIVLYSADDFGMPSGQDSFDRPENPEAHLWRTLATGRWHSLVLYEGLPPDSLKRRPLNLRNLGIEIPLIEGENYFTIVGEPGPITATDQYQRFAITLFFDGDLERPGLSVLFPRYADFEGGPTTANRSLYIYSFGVTPSQVRSPGVDDTGLDFFDDGIERVSVTGASFLPADRSEISVDQVGPQSIGASGTDDFIGTLTLLVEPSEGTGGDGAPGGRTGTGGGVPRAGGDAPRPVAPIGGGGVAPIFNNPSNFGAGSAAAAAPEPVAAAEAGEPEDPWVGGDATPTPRDAIHALKDWLQDAVEETPSGTQTPGTPSPGATPATGVGSTPTPARSATGPVGTATPGRTVTRPVGTTTPARTGTITGTPAMTPTPTRTRATVTPSAKGTGAVTPAKSDRG